MLTSTSIDFPEICRCTLCNKNVPSLKPFPGFDATRDAKSLREEMTPVGCNNEKVTNILGNRTACQRHEIGLAYTSFYDRDMTLDLQEQLGQKFHQVIHALLTPWPQVYAQIIDQVFKALYSEEAEMSLVDMICTASECELKLIRPCYLEIDEDQVGLDVHLRKELSGDFMDIMSPCTREQIPADFEKAKEEALQLVKAGDQMWCEVLEQILTRKSYQHLMALQSEYFKIKGETLVQTLEGQFSGSFLHAAKTILSISQGRWEYFANRIHDNLVMLGSNEEDLIELIILRSENDLGNIMNAYQKIYQKSLVADIEEATSGDFKQLLLQILSQPVASTLKFN